jgi:hypothetical protein
VLNQHRHHPSNTIRSKPKLWLARCEVIKTDKPNATAAYLVNDLLVNKEVNAVLFSIEITKSSA